MCSSLHTCFSAPFICDDKRTTVRRARSEFYLHQTMAAKPLCDVNFKVFPCAYLPQRGVELMDDHFHLLTASKGHDGIIASKRSKLREVGHCVKQKKNHYQAMMVNTTLSFDPSMALLEFLNFLNACCLLFLYITYLMQSTFMSIDKINLNEITSKYLYTYMYLL